MSFGPTDVAFWSLVVGGLALFLFGITFLSSNLKTVADGERFCRLISKTTSNRLKSCAVGMAFTSVIQSAGGTSALSIGLVKAGALSYTSAIAIIIGANVGQCVTAFLIAIPSISRYMPFVAFIAVFIMIVIHNRKAQTWSKILFSFSLIFFGIWLMESNLSTMSGTSWFNRFMLFLGQNPWLGLLFGTAVTLVLQSSGAVVGVIQGVYAAAVVSGGADITLFGIIPIVLGANIGAVIPSILSAIGGSPTAKRVAFVNAFMKITGALISMGMIFSMQGFLMEPHVWDPKLQIALTHLMFNLGCAIIFLPLLKPLCMLSEFVIKDKKPVGEAPTFNELNPEIIKNFPSTGLSLAGDLSVKMFEYVSKMFNSLKQYLDEPRQEVTDYVLELEKAIDKIDRHLSDFLLRAERGTLTYADQIKYSRISRAIKDIERIGDYGENLITFFSNVNEKKETFDVNQKKEIYRANEIATTLINETKEVYTNNDKDKALEIVVNRRSYTAEMEKFQEGYFARESISEHKDRVTYVSLIYVDILNCYERVYSHCANIAKLFNNDKHINHYSKTDEHIFSKMSSRY